MKALLTSVDAAIDTLIGSTLFDEPGATTRVMRSFIGALPPKRETAGQGEDFPYRLTRLSRFDLTRDGVRYTVDTELGIYIDSDDVTDGVTALDSLLAAIKTIPEAAFAPYKLIGEIAGEISQETHHPYYTITLTMVFRDHR